ncbi:YdcF family protein [Brachybacterium endophyticum]|uniref:YdcF family protein n=1 Tax=Brachybacterium endophyticum TaxID=2182385 RepID=UPI001403C5D3|nr:YdcF family protein [Brachybacterium endophyticum]
MTLRPLALAASALGGLALGVLAAGEIISTAVAHHERALMKKFADSRPTRPTRPQPSAGVREAVVVLGYGNPGPVVNAINRWRVDVGLRSIDPSADRSLLVLTGGTKHSEISEAEHMARYARTERGYDGPLVLEDRSRTTWQNVKYSIPLIQDADRIVLASDPLHTLRAQRMLRTLRPDLAARLAPARNQRLGEQILRKPVFIVVGLEGLRQAHRDHLIR